MSHSIACFRCGASLEHLSLPLSRQDNCPECGAHLHVCRMCSSFDRTAVDQCTEDDAERVREKTELNFCDWYVAAEGAFDPAAHRKHAAASAALGALFGDAEAAAADAADPDITAAEALFGEKPEQ